ncbi:MAG: hypothetical protein WA830_16650 [Candidatus Sulfotelmatobacter sp.]
MNRKIAGRIFTFVCLLHCSSLWGQATAGTKVVALRCGTLLDERGDAGRKHVVVVIEGEKINCVQCGGG